MPETYVIVGAGLAGAKAAATLREEGFDGRVVLVGEEPEQPYERPPLSKGYLAGTSPREDARVHPPELYAEHDVELVTGVRATALDARARRVRLADGESLAYDALLLATGAVPVRPPIPGADREGVQVLRSLADADALRARLRPGASVAIVGAGWIGCEVAAAARKHGAGVTLVEMASAPLERVLGRELGSFFAGLHRGHGVDLRTETSVAAIEGGAHVEAVRLADGSVVACDTVVLGVGVRPDTALAEGVLELDDGIACDERLATSDPHVWAAGDVASAWHPRYGRRVRVEHWANALHQGPAAARSMLGRGEPFARLPYFFSDQYDLGMEYAGLHDPGDRLVLRREPGARALQAFWLDARGRVTAGLHIDLWEPGIEPIKALVEAGAPVDAARLADPGVPLDALATA